MGQSDFETIIEKSADGLLVVDRRGLIQFVNRAAALILDRKKEDLLGRPFEHSLREGQVFEIDIKRGNGKTGTGELRAAAIDWNGQSATLVSIRDVTERIIYDRLKDEWIHNVSHELRTPLTSMRESMSLMYDGVLGPVNEEQKNFISMCLRNADHLKRILNNLLDISKIEAKKIRLEKKKTDLSAAVRSAVEMFVPLIRNKGLEFGINSPNQPMEVYADGDSIVQIVNNLVGNALKFTEKGRIDLTVADRNSRVECAVTDTGPGIAGEDLPKVFDKFQQFGKSVSHENKGTGLGLAITREIVRLHNGDISVESVLDRGSTFTFTFPKYSPDLEVEDQIRVRLDASKDPFILFCLQLNGSTEIDPTILSALIPMAAQTIRSNLESVGRKTTPVLVTPEKALLLIDQIQERNFKPKRDILRMVKESFFALEAESEPNFSYGMAFYPKNGQTADALMTACRNGTVDERSERMDKHILIVDDERELTEATRTLLGLFGYQNVDVANSGPAAFEKLKARIPDLIILDMKMPGMSGYEVIGRLKESFETQDIPILIMSGYEVETGRFREYISKKAILTVNKPVDGDLLRKMVYYLI